MYADITFVNMFHAILYIIGRKEIKNMSVFKRREICSVSYTLSYKKDAGTNIKLYIGNGTLYSNIQKNTMKCFKLLSFCLPNKLQTA